MDRLWNGSTNIELVLEDPYHDPGRPGGYHPVRRMVYPRKSQMAHESR
jgi:hypothetical protein